MVAAMSTGGPKDPPTEEENECWASDTSDAAPNG